MQGVRQPFGPLSITSHSFCHFWNNLDTHTSFRSKRPVEDVTFNSWNIGTNLNTLAQMVLELRLFKWEVYWFLMHVLSIFKPLWSNLTLFQDQIWPLYVLTRPKRDLKFNFGNIGTNSKALAKMFIELRLFEIKALCFFIHFLPFSVMWPYFRLKLDCCKFLKEA